ncbi:MAG: hypothetical protein RJA36_569 [Pseudomonadota bacterium]
MQSQAGQEAQRFEYYPTEQARLEAALVRRRQQAEGGEAGTGNDLDTIANSQGLALSGGGIRSATFNLGLLQSLAAAGQLREFDFLSTVSGGGYIGACLGRLYERSAHEHTQAGKGKPSATQTASDVEQVLASDEAPLIRWLRDHGRYLAPQGLKDRLFALGIYLRNMLTVHMLLGMALLGGFLGWDLLRRGLLWLMGQKSLPAAEFVRTLREGGYSPAWLLAGLALLFSLGCVWAYWMHRTTSTAGREQRGVALALALGSAFSLLYPPGQSGLVAALLMTGLLTAMFALGFSWRADRLASGQENGARRAAIRHRLTVWLRGTTMALLGLVLFALLDEAAHHAYRWLTSDSRLGSGLLLGGGLGGALLAGLRAFAQGMAASQAGRGGAGASRWFKPAVNALGIVLLGGVTFFWALAAVACTEMAQGSSSLIGTQAAIWRIAPMLLALWVLTWLNRHPDLLNLSSLHHFYAARLARAYLGPGNPERGVPWAPHPVKAQAGKLKRVDEVVQGDDMKWDSYRPHEHGGPLHLVNVNVNQTRFFTNSDFQPDRQGWNLAVGPAGFNLGRSVWQSADWKDKEELRLGHWMAISGAAFTTGAGARTGLGFSALLGLLGVRLGYWWRAGDQDPGRQPKPRTHHALVMLRNEITGSFNPDDDKHWYLSDGGHFENCAAYELIRRRLKRIVVADCGADPEYGFEDLANLALKARLDFGAELTVLGVQDLDGLWAPHPELRALFAEPSQMDGRSGPGLLLARVDYHDDPVPGWMVIVKPRLPAELPPDLANYAINETDFPQQSTLDQFYDEAQWESTRKLGRLQGEQLSKVLKHLPGWQNPGTAPVAPIIGAPWDRAAAQAQDPAAADSEGGNPLKIYAPVFVALWTAFEFYSSYQQQAAKQADEVTRVALSRIDRLEDAIFGQGGCKALVDCPSVPTHVGLIRDMINSERPPASVHLMKLLDNIEKSVGAGRVSTDAAQITAASASPLPMALPGREDVKVDIERAWVYVQIYDEERRPEASALIQRLRAAGMERERTPGIENVTRTAAARQAKAPVPYAQNTVIYFHEKDERLATWIGSQIDLGQTKAFQLKLLKNYAKVPEGQVEVWLPPRRP